MDLQFHYQFFPVLIALFWFVLISLFFGLIRSKKGTASHYNYFLSSLFAKLGSSIVFSSVYLLLYEGGDTLAYWDGAISLHNLLFESPIRFLNEIMTSSGESNMGINFSYLTTYPPGWIYRETESFFVSKLTVFLSIITFKSYFASTLIVASIMTLSSWHLFCSLRMIKLFDERILAISILFTPTVLFWCTGISKDSYVLISLLILISCLIRIFVLKQKVSKYIFLILVSVFFIYSMRLYVLIAILPSLLMAYNARISKSNIDSSFKRRSIKFGIYAMSVFVLLAYFQLSTAGNGFEGIFNEIIVIQQDFANNTTYGDKKYDLFLTDYTIPSVMRSIPNALIAAFYRPFPWEAVSPLLIFNGIENLILMLLTIRFFGKNAGLKIKQIGQEEILVFSFVFVLIMGFSIGFTSGLFGVLVRFKSIILPFMLILLTFKPNRV
ncbi:MAG: hypothetical protein KJ941_03210 [Bacteroidetes bacterium]|nr:hypothetical protein [Bacteroidota bacterium]